MQEYFSNPAPIIHSTFKWKKFTSSLLVIFYFIVFCLHACIFFSIIKLLLFFSFYIRIFVGLKVVLNTFEAQPLSDEEGDANNLEEEAVNFSIKYLTSSKLMGLEVSSLAKSWCLLIKMCHHFFLRRCSSPDSAFSLVCFLLSVEFLIVEGSKFSTSCSCAVSHIV